MGSRLPRQDGFEVLAEMRNFESLQQTPVLLANDGDVTADQSARAMALGAIGIKTGPVSVKSNLIRAHRSRSFGTRTRLDRCA